MPSPNASSSEPAACIRRLAAAARRRSRSPSSHPSRVRPRTRTERDQADRHCRERRSEVGLEPRDQVREQADLGEQTQGKGRGNRHEARLSKERSARRRCLRCRRGNGRFTPQETPRQRTDDRDRGAGHHKGGERQPDARDQCGPQRRENDTADAGAIEGDADRLRPVALEPRRDHGVERRAAHRRPSCAAQQQAPAGIATACCAFAQASAPAPASTAPPSVTRPTPKRR